MPSVVAEKAPEASTSALNPNEWKAFKVQSIDTGGPPNTNRYRSGVPAAGLPAQAEVRPVLLPKAIIPLPCDCTNAFATGLL